MVQLKEEVSMDEEDKRFMFAYGENGGKSWAVRDYDITLWRGEVVGTLNQLHEKNIQLEKENSKLKNEINMLKTTIARNELYIRRLTSTGEWRS